MGSETESGREWAIRRIRNAPYEEMTDDELKAVFELVTKRIWRVRGEMIAAHAKDFYQRYRATMNALKESGD